MDRNEIVDEINRLLEKGFHCDKQPLKGFLEQLEKIDLEREKQSRVSEVM